MKREIGCLILRNGIWHVRWKYEKVQHQQSTGCTDRDEAETVAADIVAPFLARRHQDVAAALAGRVEAAGRAVVESTPPLAVADLWEAYVRSPSRPDAGEDTMRMYKAQVGRFVRWAAAAAPGAREVRQVTAATASRFLSAIAGDVSANTYNKYIVLLRRVWRCVKAEARWTGDNPWGEVRRRHGESRRRRALSVEEIEALVETAEGEWRLLVLVGAYAGLRLGDAARLSAEDIREGRICLAPRKTERKSGAEVRIPLHPRLAAALADTHIKHGPYMPGLAEAYARDCGGVSRRLARLFRRAGIATSTRDPKTGRMLPTAGFHSLRHSFISRLADSGAPLTLVQALAGHSTPAMTAHYYHADDARAAAAVAALDGGMDAAARKTRIAELEAELAKLKGGKKGKKKASG